MQIYEAKSIRSMRTANRGMTGLIGAAGVATGNATVSSWTAWATGGGGAAER